MNPATGSNYSAVNGPNTGVSNFHTTSFNFNDGGAVTLYSIYAKGMVVDYQTRIRIIEGAHTRGGIYYTGRMPYDQATATVDITSGAVASYPPTRITNAAGAGIIARNSAFIIGSTDPIVIADCLTHGIILEHSELKMLAGVTGTGNGGAGVYAYAGSVILITNGSPPTLTGTVGNLAITDPTIEDTTWANIDAGIPISIMAEATMAKEI